MNRAALSFAALVALTATARADEEVAISAGEVEYGADGLRIESEVLATGKVDGAILDPGYDALWFVQKQNLYLISLANDDWTPVLIAKGMPPGAWSIAEMAEHGTSEAGLYPIINDNGKTTVGEGLATGVSRAVDARARKAIKKVKIVGAKAFKTLSFHKPYEGRYGLPSELASFSFVHPPPRTAGDCKGANSCGSSAQLPYHRDTWLEIAARRCDAKGCHDRCLLHSDLGWAIPDAAGAWMATPPASDGGCYGYVWAPDGTFSVGEARCKLDEHGVTCTKEPRWTAAGWIAWPFAVVQSRPQREGTDRVQLMEIAKASPWKGLPAISVDGAAAILPVRNHDSGGEVNDYDYCDAGTTTCERQSMGHDQVTADVFEAHAGNRLRATQYVPMPYWDVDAATTRLRTDYGMIELARAKGGVTVTVTDWNDFAMGTKTFAVGASLTVLGVAIAQGPRPSLYVRFGSYKTKTSRPDDDWRFFPLTLPPP